MVPGQDPVEQRGHCRLVSALLATDDVSEHPKRTTSVEILVAPWPLFPKVDHLERVASGLAWQEHVECQEWPSSLAERDEFLCLIDIVYFCL